MKKLSLFSVLGMLMFVNAAKAGILIDPYIGSGQYKSTFDFPGPSDESESYMATGARVGWTFLLLSAGIDYQMGTTKLLDEDLKATNTSFFVGVDLPILLRAWGEYFISSSLSGDASEVDDMTFKDGYSLGIGFTGLPFISLNLELQNINYEYDDGSAKGDINTANTIFSVSLPLSF